MRLMEIYQNKDKKRFGELSRQFFMNCKDVALLNRFDKEYEIFQLERLVEMYITNSSDNRPNMIRLSDSITCSFRVFNTWWLGTATGGIYKVTLSDDDLRFQAVHYSSDSGFIGRSVNHILNDSKGNQWISCLGDQEKTGGLFQYDGKKFRQYTSRNGLSADSILAVCERDKKIYCLSTKGIYVSELSVRPEWRKISYISGATDFTVGTGERIIFTDGSSCSVLEKGKIHGVQFEDSLGTVTQSGLKIRRIESGTDGTVFIYTDRGLYRESQMKARLIYTPAAGYDMNTTSFLAEEDDTWFGHTGGIFRHHPLYTLQYDTSDGLPRGPVISLNTWKGCKIAVTAGGLILMTESGLDTAKMIRSIVETENRMIGNGMFSQARQLYRRLPKNTLLQEFGEYRIGLLFRKEEKTAEAYHWLKEHAKNDHSFINPYVFWRLGMDFIEKKDPDRAYNIFLDAVGKYSSSTGESQHVRFADMSKSSGFALTVDMVSERNLMIRSFETGMRQIADDYRMKNNSTQAVLWHLRASEVFLHMPCVPEGMLNLACNAEDRDDLRVAQCLYRAIQKNSVTGDGLRLYQVGWKLADLYRKTGQYKESSEIYKRLAEFREFNPVRPLLIRLAAQMDAYGLPGVRKGGYDESNITNDMVFEGHYLWLGTSKGVIRWDLSNNSYKKWNENNGLIVDNIYSVAISQDGGKWFSGYKMLPNGQINGGVSYFDGEMFTNFTKGQGLTTGEVNCVAVDHNGIVWIGTNQGVSRFRNGWRHYTLKDKFPFSQITGLAFDSQNQLWISCLSKNDFYSSSGGLIRFDDSLSVVMREKNGLSSNNVKSIFVDDMDNLWLNTDKGITIYNVLSGTMKYLNEKNGLPSLVIRDVEFADSNQLWVCTNSGIARLDWHEQLTRGSAVSDQTASVIIYSEKDGLLTNDIRRAAFHPEHGVWVGTRRGSFSIGRLNPDQDDEGTLTSYNKKLFEINSESESLFERAQQYIETGEYDKAREIYLDVLDRSGTQNWADDAVLLLAKSYEMEGNYEESQKYYEMLISNYPESDLASEAYIGIGMIAEKNNRFDEAINAYSRAEEKTDNKKSVVNQTQILKQKAEIRKISHERAQTEKLAALISEKTNELSAAKDKDTDQITKELRELEDLARKSAKAAGYHLRLYKVKPDDTLWDLSRQFLGDANKWKDFFVANEGKISDPNMIYQAPVQSVSATD